MATVAVTVNSAPVKSIFNYTHPKDHAAAFLGTLYQALCIIKHTLEIQKTAGSPQAAQGLELLDLPLESRSTCVGQRCYDF